MRKPIGQLPVEDENKGIEGKYEFLMRGHSPYFTDNPREAIWLANKYGGMVINNHSDDERECYQQNGKWAIQYRSKC